MTADERIASLEEQLKEALEQIRVFQEELAAAHKRIEELEKQKTPPAAFVKANVKMILTRFSGDRKQKPSWVRSVKAEPLLSCLAPVSMNPLRYGNEACVRIFIIFEYSTKLGQHHSYACFLAYCESEGEAR